jgi:hypothetical protein
VKTVNKGQELRNALERVRVYCKDDKLVREHNNIQVLSLMPDVIAEAYMKGRGLFYDKEARRQQSTSPEPSSSSSSSFSSSPGEGKLAAWKKWRCTNFYACKLGRNLFGHPPVGLAALAK